MKVSTLVLLLTVCIANYRNSVSSLKTVLDPELAASLAHGNANNVWDIVVEMEGGVNSVMDGTTTTLSYLTLTRGEKASLLSQQLIAYSKEAQKDVFAVMSNPRKSSTATARSAWITNSIFVHGADKALIEALTKAKGVETVREQIVIQLDVEPVQPLVETSQGGNGWNIVKVGAPDVWSKNYTGMGVLVGHIDTGVRYTHVALRAGWVGGAGGWFDPNNASSTLPYDSNSISFHGTHTLATAVGNGGVGIAPGAKWMSCLGCQGLQCIESDLTLCGQFMFCPRTDSSSPCAAIPNIVTNSWGSNQYAGTGTFYDNIIRAWRNVGIIPVFAAGNTGPNCSSVNQPCNNKDVICVGAVSDADALASFSSVGPSNRGETGVYKPEIVAPGVQIRSATGVDDSSYGILNGTSQATPHVAGAIALLLSADSKFTFSTVRKALLENAWRVGLVSAPSCDPANSEPWPNQKFGYGRLRLANVNLSSGGRGESSVLTVAMGSLAIFLLMAI